MLKTHSLRVSVFGGLLAVLSFANLGVAADVAAAEALFQEGRRLMLEGKTKDGCDKLAASQRLDPSSGTMINLATCHAKLGLTATAWAEFLSAARLAYAQGRPSRAAEAERQAAELAPRVSYLTIQVEREVPGLVVKRGSTDVGESAFGVELPVDPGTHTISASAPGYETWSTTITVGSAAERKTVTVPTLAEPAPEPEAVAPLPVAPRGAELAAPTPPRVAPEPNPGTVSNGSGSGPVFWIASGTTVAATGVMTVFGLLSRDSYRDAERICPEHVECEPRAIQLSERADKQANVANVALGTAIAAAAVAGVLYFLADDPAPHGREVRSGLTW